MSQDTESTMISGINENDRSKLFPALHNSNDENIYKHYIVIGIASEVILPARKTYFVSAWLVFKIY